MPGGGPTPAETTLPLALSWPAPPAVGPRPPRITPPGPPEGPGGWRRVPRPDERPAPGPVQPRYQPPGYRPPDAPGPYREPPRTTRGRPRPVKRPQATPQATPRANLVRSGAGMAVGTLVSRGTGFLRTLVLVYAVGLGHLGNAYNSANTLPNLVYYLMLGGIFTSVVVPLLVRAAKRDPDRGEAYAQRLFSLGALALLVVTVLATLAAGPLVDLLAPGITGAQHNLMVVWAYFFIPQIFFYGMSSLIGAVLNTRGRFAAPMWTPVINNLVVIVVGGLYIVVAGTTKTPRPSPRPRCSCLASAPPWASSRRPSRCSLRCAGPGSAGGPRSGSTGPRSRKSAGWPGGCWSTSPPSRPGTRSRYGSRTRPRPARTESPPTPSRGSCSSFPTPSSASR